MYIIYGLLRKDFQMEKGNQSKSMDTRDYTKLIGIEWSLSMKKILEVKKLYAAKYWADYGKIQ